MATHSLIPLYIRYPRISENFQAVQFSYLSERIVDL